MGLTFKENCLDVRNTKVIDIVNTLKDYDVNITLFDPLADPAEVKHEYNWDSVTKLNDGDCYDAVIIAVAHDEFRKLDIQKLCKQNKVIYDVKGMLAKDKVDGRL